MELTVLMPCLNEAETLVDCIKKAKDFLHRENIHGEVLISDNGSTDGSATLAEKHGARVVYSFEKGYGSALLTGINAAQGKYIIMGDADGSYDFLNLGGFVEKLRNDYDLVMGNRFKGGIKPGAMPFLNKYLGNPVLSFTGRLFFKCQVKDFHCGLRGFRKESIQALELQAMGMEFASEMVVKAVLKSFKITEIPTILSPDGRSRPPHLRRWRDGWRHLRFLLLSSPRWLFLFPGICLTGVGLLLMSILSVMPLKIGNLVLDIHTLLFSSAFVILGVQLLFFALFCKIIAVSNMNLQPGRQFLYFLRNFTLERGIGLGFILLCLGGAGACYSVIIWMQAQFGELLPTKMMRLIIPSITLIITGSQIVFYSFFLSLPFFGTIQRIVQSIKQQSI
jgi:glycosyltransferase involved in cell wall biosynthesis